MWDCDYVITLFNRFVVSMILPHIIVLLVRRNNMGRVWGANKLFSIVNLNVRHYPKISLVNYLHLKTLSIPSFHFYSLQ